MTTTITTVLRLADDSTVPIVLCGTRCGWLRVITVKEIMPKQCRRGHILIGNNALKTRNGYERCRICHYQHTRNSRARCAAQAQKSKGAR